MKKAKVFTLTLIFSATLFFIGSSFSSTKLELNDKNVSIEENVGSVPALYRVCVGVRTPGTSTYDTEFCSTDCSEIAARMCAISQAKARFGNNVSFVITRSNIVPGQCR